MAPCKWQLWMELGWKQLRQKAKYPRLSCSRAFPFENIKAIVFSWSKLSSEKTSLNWRIWTKKGRIEVGPCNWWLHSTNWMGSGGRRDIFDFPANAMGTLSRQLKCKIGCASEELLKSSKKTRIKEEAYDLPRNSANFRSRSDALQMISSHNELRGKQLGTSSTFWMGAPRSNQLPAFQICWNWPLRKLKKL